MIDPKELRIGNWIKYNSDISLKSELINTEVKVTADVIKWASNPSENCYEPIPLTPEILERCGFEKINDFYSIRIDEYIWLHLYEDGIYGFWSDSLENESNFTVKSQDNRIQYLHELQNLILDLTKKELVIKEL